VTSKISRAAVALCWLFSGLAGTVFAQMPVSPVPYGGGNSEAFPPFQRVRPIPPDPPSAADQKLERLPNGYTQQQMDYLKADPHVIIHPDGTIERVHPSLAEKMQATRNNPHVPQPPAGWNSRDASDPQKLSTPGIATHEIPGPKPINPRSK
jgi:hypothetical protein